MLIKNVSQETLQRNDAGPWTSTKPGGTLELTKEQAEWLAKHEPHFWQIVADADTVTKTEPEKKPAAPTKRGGK